MYDIIIIGAGPAGYVAAIRSAQVGLKTLVIEKKYLGGMCLNWGCIATKSLIESAKLYQRIKNADKFGIEGIEKKNLNFNWLNATKRADTVVKRLTRGIDYLFKKNAVELIMGEAVINSPNSVSVDNRNFEAKNILIATGSYPQKLEKIENTEIEQIITYESLPENIAVIGSGGTAIEMAQLFAMIDKKVTLIVNDSKLLPLLDEYLINYINKKLNADKIKVINTTDIKEYNNGTLKVAAEEIKADIIINCNKRRAILPKMNIDIAKDEKGYIKTNEKLQTNVESIYAIGDVNGRSYLAHIASAQGLFVVNSIKGIESDFNLNLYPHNLYTNPEMAQIGISEQEAKAKNLDYKVSEFPLTANGRALTEDLADGLIRMISDKKYGEVLGVQIIAHNATDLISEASAYMQLEGTIYDVAQTIHAHPTISEIYMEAGFDAVDKAIHK